MKKMKKIRKFFKLFFHSTNYLESELIDIMGTKFVEKILPDLVAVGVIDCEQEKGDADLYYSKIESLSMIAIDNCICRSGGSLFSFLAMMDSVTDDINKNKE